MKHKGTRKKVKGKSAEALFSVFCLFTFTFLLALGLAGCGNVGPPIAPESIGVAAKLKKEQLKKEQEKAAPGEPGREAPPPEAEAPSEEEALPEFRPIGTPR